MAETSKDLARQRENLIAKLDAAIQRLAETRVFAKPSRQGPVLDLGRRVAVLPGGLDAVYRRAQALEEAGIYVGTDWAAPETLLPTLSANTIRRGEARTATLEVMSELRFLAVANGDYEHETLSSEYALHFLSQVVALNLNLLFGGASEADREGSFGTVLPELYELVAAEIGYENIFDKLISEIWRVLAQRPITVDKIKNMVTQIAACVANPEIDTGTAQGRASRLIAALYTPTRATAEDPGLSVYAERLHAMDATALGDEARGFARAMHDTGLVSPYHPVLLRHLKGGDDGLITAALGLSPTGHDGLLCYRDLIHRLIDEAIHPETCQAVYGLALMLERGLLYHPSVAPALWRQIRLQPCLAAATALTAAFGAAQPPRVTLLAGLLSILGQPLGVGQGNNPTCQAARALSMWSLNDADFLLQVLAWAARDDEVVIAFEGAELSSRELIATYGRESRLDIDPVSVVVVPHLDRIYQEMLRRCADRPGDPHRWINPELHGWWVGRGCRLAVDVATGKVSDYGGFVRHFYAAYHPFYNGNQPVIHPQPAGIAITNSSGRFVGWHAIAILRVAIDRESVMRVYFFNPNNDSGQDWGRGVMVSTEGHGERYGEASLPMAEFASRLYLFHFDPLERGNVDAIPAEDVARVTEMARESWAKTRF